MHAFLRPRRPLLLRRRGAAGLAGALAGALALCGALAGAARASCVDEDRFDLQAGSAGQGAASPADPAAPRQQLLALVQDALARSHGIGAARLQAEAALNEVLEAKASRLPQAALTGSLVPTAVDGSSSSGVQVQASAGVTLSQSLYDGGRSDRMVDWRRQQAEGARLGLLSTQEQITLAATSLALERSRYRMQAAIYTQNVRKMGCLVQALETIVGADRGRTSELVQARKQMQQAELQQAQSASQARQVEARLRRMAGDGLPGTEGLATLLLAVPELPDVLSAAERANDITMLDASAGALREMARVVEAGGKPQVSWTVGGSTALVAGAGKSRNSSLSAGLSVSIPLLNPAVDYTVQAARKRAEAAQAQRAEALEQRRQRIVDVHEQAGAAFDRLRRVSLVLKDSDRLRNFTLQQWQQLGRRSLFDVIAAESDHYSLRVQYINALHDGQQMNAMLNSLGTGLVNWLQAPLLAVPPPSTAPATPP